MKVYETQLNISARFNQPPPPVPPAIAHLLPDVVKAQQEVAAQHQAARQRNPMEKFNLAAITDKMADMEGEDDVPKIKLGDASPNTLPHSSTVGLRGLINQNNRDNFYLRPSAVRNMGMVTRIGEASGNIPATARPRRGRAQSMGPLGPISAPAEGKVLAALADAKETALAETSITDISDTSFQTTSEEILEGIKTESFTSDNNMLDGYNINREIPIPPSTMTNLQDRTGVTQEKPCRQAEAEGARNEGQGNPQKEVEAKQGPEAPTEEQGHDNVTTH
ncbi:Cation-transporting ATPase 4 [Termitomyces sp. J132]|nr:Cation-transporting ATPase 4 [Termitomyces sp. J132]